MMPHFIAEMRDIDPASARAYIFGQEPFLSVRETPNTSRASPIGSILGIASS
jgi:accessory colonization factor AcfC